VDAGEEDNAAAAGPQQRSTTASVFQALDDPGASRKKVDRALEALAEKDAQHLRREEAIQEVAPRLADHLQKVWRQALGSYGSAAFSAAVSMAVRGNADDEGRIDPECYGNVVWDITRALYEDNPHHGCVRPRAQLRG
jgi:hypothetical protein